MSDPNNTNSNTVNSAQSAIPNTPLTFDSIYGNITNLTKSNLNSADKPERAYRIAGIIDLNTGTTKDVVYQVDLGETEKVPRGERNNTDNTIPDYSTLANPVVLEKKDTSLSLIRDNLTSVGSYVKDFFNNTDKTKFSNMLSNIENDYKRQPGMSDTDYISNLPEATRGDYLLAKKYLNPKYTPEDKEHQTILSKKLEEYKKQQDENRNKIPTLNKFLQKGNTFFSDDITKTYTEIENEYNNGIPVTTNYEIDQFVNKLPFEVKDIYVYTKYRNINSVPETYKSFFERGKTKYEEAIKVNREENLIELLNIGGGRRANKSRRANKTKRSNKTKRTNKRSNKTRKFKA